MIHRKAGQVSSTSFLDIHFFHKNVLTVIVERDLRQHILQITHHLVQLFISNCPTLRPIESVQTVNLIKLMSILIKIFSS